MPQTYRHHDSCPTCHTGTLVWPNERGPATVTREGILLCDIVGCGTSVRATVDPDPAKMTAHHRAMHAMLREVLTELRPDSPVARNVRALLRAIEGQS